MSAGAFLIARGPDGKDRPVLVTEEGVLRVDIAGAALELDASGVEIKNDSGSPIPVVDGLSIPRHDDVDITRVDRKIVNIEYKLNSATVASLAFTYDANGDLIRILKS
jgi:hypothetical protein